MLSEKNIKGNMFKRVIHAGQLTMFIHKKNRVHVPVFNCVSYISTVWFAQCLAWMMASLCVGASLFVIMHVRLYEQSAF